MCHELHAFFIDTAHFIDTKKYR